MRSVRNTFCCLGLRVYTNGISPPGSSVVTIRGGAHDPPCPIGDGRRPAILHSPPRADYSNVEATTKTLEDNHVHTLVSAITMIVPSGTPPEFELIRAADASKTTKRIMVPATTVIDARNNAVSIPGSGNMPVAFTHTSDVAKYVAALLDLNKWEPESFVVGDKVTLNEFLHLAEAAKGTR
jgi:hypothetical protein